MSRLAALAAVVIVGWANGGPDLLWADPARPPEKQPASQPAAPVVGEDKAAARELFAKANELHDNGEYLAAATEYLEAYRDFPAPAFLFNVGQVYRLAEQDDLALEHYRRYLVQEPEGEGAAEARQFIEEIEAAAAAKSPGEPAPKPTLRPLDGRWREVDSLGLHGNDDRGSQPGRRLKVAGLVVGGVGVVGLIAAGGFALKARSIERSLSGYTGPWTDEQADEYERGEQAESNARLGLIVGGTALATGVVLYWVGRTRSRREADQPRVTLSPTADGGWAAFSGSF